MKYYCINESLAQTAHNMNHMSSYVDGSMTANYRKAVDKCYEIGESQKAAHPECAEKIDILCDKYAKKLADWYNTSFKIESMCPSIMISGASNFPVHKKEKQNARRDAHAKEYEAISAILEKIKAVGTGGIKSGDADAVEKLRQKLRRREEIQEHMKSVNAYYRKHHTLEGCKDLTPAQMEKANADMNSPWCTDRKPYPSYALTNNSAEIRRLKERLAKLETEKATGNTETEEINGVKIVENTDMMRIQLVFDGKPSVEIRACLKEHGFRWAPSIGVWQRVLNDNGRRAARAVIAKVKEADGNESV